MATRLAAAVVVVAAISLIVSTIVGITSGRDLDRDINHGRLESLGRSGATEIATQATSLSRSAVALAASPQAAIGVAEFSAAFQQLDEAAAETTEEDLTALVDAYRDEYLDPLQAAGVDLQLRDVASDDARALYLQFAYAVDIGPVEEPAVIDTADDGTSWTEVHEVLHPVYRDVVRGLSLVDLLLIDGDGRVVYSVRKRPDLGTSLQAGPFSGSAIAATLDNANEAGDGDVVMSDLSNYLPHYEQPVGAHATPIFDGSRRVGAVMLIYDAQRFTESLTAGGDWDNGGFPPTGNMYLAGADGTVRSEPRSYLEDPDAHLDAAIEAGTIDSDDREIIEFSGTTVLTQRIADGTATAIRDGDASVSKRLTMVGNRALVTFEPVPVDDVEWYVVTEVDTSASEQSLRDFEELLVVGVAIFVVLLAFLAVGWATNIMRPVRAISDRLGSTRRTDEPIDVPPQTPIEIQQLAGAFEEMAQSLEAQRRAVAAARDDRLDVLRSMLPPSVAERVSAGDLQTVDEIPLASVAVVVVLGLGELVRSEESDRSVVDQLHAELDTLADHHGLNRIHVVGDAYFASCGHDRPYIDHAPRTVAFATDAQEVVETVARSTGAHLGTAIGVHTGPVFAGMSGSAHLVYDVWGETVAVANMLARAGSAGDIVLSDDTRRMLPTHIAVAPVTPPFGGIDEAAALWRVVVEEAAEAT